MEVVFYTVTFGEISSPELYKSSYPCSVRSYDSKNSVLKKIHFCFSNMLDSKSLFVFSIFSIFFLFDISCVQIVVSLAMEILILIIWLQGRR